MFGAFQTFGKLGAIGKAIAAAWSPLSLWPDGISSAGMWISPRDLTSQWQGYTGTTPVATPGTVADSSNPVGLALDLRAGNPVPLGPELVTNGDFSDGTTGFTAVAGSVLAVTAGVCRATVTPGTGDAGFTFNLSAAPVVGRTYEYTFSIQNISGFSAWVFDGPLNSYVGSGLGVFTFKQVAVSTSLSMLLRSAYGGAAGSYIEFDNISVKEVPGTHMLQSTSAARPLLSARVNKLTYTEDFSNAAWSKAAVTVNSDVSVAPDGTTTADSLIEDSTLAGHYVYSMQIAVTSGIVVTISVRAKNASGTRWFQISMGGAVMGGAVGKFDLVNGAAVSVPGTSSGVAAITDIGNGWYLCQFTFIPTSSGNTNVFLGMGDSSGSSFLSPYQGDGSSGFYIWGAQYEQGPTATAYQRVNTASDYDASAGPTYLKFDGVDDSLASATFAAGTLTSSMDCLIAVRRDSAAHSVLVSQTTSKFFGYFDLGVGGLSVNSAGTPTLFVDGTQLAGGTSVTPDTLNTALTVGNWHIVEYRGLDVSSWTSIGVGTFTSYGLNGALGGIQLFASGQDANRDLARAQMAAYFGVTLP